MLLIRLIVIISICFVGVYVAEAIVGDFDDLDHAFDLYMIGFATATILGIIDDIISGD